MLCQGFICNIVNYVLHCKLIFVSLDLLFFFSFFFLCGDDGDDDDDIDGGPIRDCLV